MHRILTLAVSALLALGLFTALAETPTPAPTPAPAVLTFQKFASPSVVNIGQPVTFTILVTNTGGTPAIVQATDLLPLGDQFSLFDWGVTQSTFTGGCAMTLNFLSCGGIVPARHLGALDYENGTALVAVTGFARECGNVTNYARLFSSPAIELTTGATVQILCPATPTPVPPTPTPTSIPTVTPVPPTSTPPPTAVATATPASVGVAPTVSATLPRLVPRPPNTGSGMQPVDGTNYTARKVVLMIAGIFGLGVVVYTARKRL